MSLLNCFKKKALVTGAGGVVGYAVCNLLVRHGYAAYPVYWSTSLPAYFPTACKKYSVCVDLTDAISVSSTLGMIKPDFILHLAANNDSRLTPENSQEILRQNLLSTVNILSAVADSALKIPILITSTSAGNEDTRDLKNHTPYVVSKRAVEMIANSYNLNYGLEVMVLRLGNVYGPGDRHAQRLVPSIIDSIIKDTAPIFRSPLTESRKFIYSLTLAKALLWLINNRKQASQTLLTLNGEHLSTLAHVHEILRLVSTENYYSRHFSRLNKLQTDDFWPRLSSSELIVKDVELELGLLETFHWYRQNTNVQSGKFFFD